MFVKIPIIEQHMGLYLYVREVEIAELCPVCGMPRGKNTIHNVRSYDGSRFVICDGWENPCGHVDKYSDVRKEALQIAKLRETQKLASGGDSQHE